MSKVLIDLRLARWSISRYNTRLAMVNGCVINHGNFLGALTFRVSHSLALCSLFVRAHLSLSTLAILEIQLGRALKRMDGVSRWAAVNSAEVRRLTIDAQRSVENRFYAAWCACSIVKIFDFVAVLNCRIIKFSFLCFSEWLDKVENVWKIRNCPCKLNLNGFKSKNFSLFPFHCAITRIYFSRNHDSLGCLMCGIIHRLHRIDDGHTMNLARGESR